jgi:hypothetical protein
MQFETLKIQRTVQPEQQPSQEQWEQEYFTGARLKPEIHAFSACPLEAYLKFIDNALINQNN